MSENKYTPVGQYPEPPDLVLNMSQPSASAEPQPETPTTATTPLNALPQQNKPKAPLKDVQNALPTFMCLLYIAATGFYFYARVSYTIDLGSLRSYGIFVLCIEGAGVLAVLPYAILLTRSTVPSDPQSTGLKPVEKEQTWDPDEMKEEGKRYDFRPLLAGLAKYTFVILYAANRMHVRVLVPCYQEDLAVIEKTVKGALNAKLPEGVARTVYLCDDGKAIEKQKFIETLGPYAKYVTGRKKNKGDINGKSANLNNCIKNNIYKRYIDEATGELQWEDIPLSEMVVVFDADMIANEDFFLRILEVMADEDMALCLSPQCFGNIEQEADIFNNINIQFWEYWLPGANAQKYIACTGTNFCIRSRPIAHCGLFPTYTITEDYALGMELKRKGYRGSYLLKYIAKGEAPDEVRNVMRQRSRWTKGHMQVFFSFAHCPLFLPGLPFAQRLWYCYGTYSYFATVLTSPTFLLLPFLGLVFGIYPVSLNWWFAVSTTIYYTSGFAIQSYVNRGAHVQGMWFGQIANQILCFTFFKAIVNVLISGTGWKQVGFKATDKTKTVQPVGQPNEMEQGLLEGVHRSDSSINPAFQYPPGEIPAPAGMKKKPPRKGFIDKVWERLSKLRIPMPSNINDVFAVLDPLVLIACFLLCCVTFAAGVYRLMHPAQNQTSAYVGLPMMWAINQCVPFYLFIHYCLTSGPSFKVACKMGQWVQVLAGLGAVIFLWFNVPEEVELAKALDATTAMWATQRSGDLGPVRSQVPDWRGNSFVNDSVPGGFYVDGTHVKYTLPMATSITFLAWAYLEFPEAFNQQQKLDVLNNIKWGAYYLLNAYQEDENGKARYVARIGDPVDYLTTKKAQEDGAIWTNPERDPTAYNSTKREPVLMEEGVSVGVDVLGSAAAAMAAAAIALKEDKAFSGLLLRRAALVYDLARSTPGEEQSYCAFVNCTTVLPVDQQLLVPTEIPKVPPICWITEFLMKTCVPLYTADECLSTSIQRKGKHVYGAAEDCCDKLIEEDAATAIKTTALPSAGNTVGGSLDGKTKQGICALNPEIVTGTKECFIPDLALATCVRDELNEIGGGCAGTGLEIYATRTACCNRMVDMGIITMEDPAFGSCSGAMESCWVPLLTKRTCVAMTGSDCRIKGVDGAFNLSTACCEFLYRELVQPDPQYHGKPIAKTQGICKTPPVQAYSETLPLATDGGRRRMFQSGTPATDPLLPAPDATRPFQREFELKSVPTNFTFFNSTYVLDDLAWGGAWLYRATKRDEFLGAASEYLRQHYLRETDPNSLTEDSKYYYADWNNLAWATNVLLATMTKHQDYRDRAKTFLKAWTGKPTRVDNEHPDDKIVPPAPPTSDIVLVENKEEQQQELCRITERHEFSCENKADDDCDGLMDYADPDCPFTPVRYTKSELAWTPDEPLPRAAMASFLALIYSNKMGDMLTYRQHVLLDCWALGQVRFILGTDKSGRSYVVGIGNDYPKQVQHRAASCDTKKGTCNWFSGFYPNAPNPHNLLGALVAGPDYDEAYKDQRNEANSQIGLHYTVGLQGAIAGLIQRKVTIQKCSTYNGLWQAWFETDPL